MLASPPLRIFVAAESCGRRNRKREGRDGVAECETGPNLVLGARGGMALGWVEFVAKETCPMQAVGALLAAPQLARASTISSAPRLHWSL
jgi:hypothetical protein